ncbi:MAG: HAD-IIIA family hydrolase [candidate division Zixibacteria bacterium]|nr:HAD-IIIA family hydrolase [candidate division Zixibacteria bacterium]
MIKRFWEKLSQIKMVIFDVDGVLTDNAVYIGPDGFELKRFNIADGLGIHIAQKHGIRVALLSGRQSSATTARAKELGIEDVYQDSSRKLDNYNALKSRYHITDGEILFVGNDLIDIPIMEICGVAVAVPDSPKSVLKAALYVTQAPGGYGVAREIIDMILDARGIDEEKRLA